MIIRARAVLPISQPPIQNGAVVVFLNKIAAVGSWNDLKSKFSAEEVFDLGDVILLPGLVNAHCHLDYTDMAGLIPPPKSFTEWIPQIMSAKAAWNYSEYARSWLNGAKMLLQTGTTTVADIEAVPHLLPDVWGATPLRVYSFIEYINIRSQKKPKEILRETVRQIESLQHERSRAFLSPHAPYTVTDKLLKLSRETARRKNWRITTHIAESADEFEMFAESSGRMFDWLSHVGRDNSDCGLFSPVQIALRAGLLGDNFLAVHVNCLAHGDATILAKKRVNVVHCPRSHDYFKHPPFLFERLSNAGVNICLGTDSLASMSKNGKKKPELNMFEEMRTFAVMNGNVLPERILQMATINGAKALGLVGQVGEISKNALADMIAIPFQGKDADIYNTVLHHPSTISAGMVDGKWTITP